MGRVIRLLLILIVLGVVGLIGYSYSGFMGPETREITEPVTLDAD